MSYVHMHDLLLSIKKKARVRVRGGSDLPRLRRSLLAAVEGRGCWRRRSQGPGLQALTFLLSRGRS